MNFNDEFADIPDNIKGGLTRYVENHIQPGGFLTAMICGDLFEAVRRADPESRKAIPLIAIWLDRTCPGLCGAANMREHLANRKAQ